MHDVRSFWTKTDIPVLNSHLMRKAADFRRGARWPLPSVSIIFLTALLLLASGGCGGGAPAQPPASNPAPSITSLSPSSAVAGAAAQTLTINGTNFLSTSTVTYNGVAHTAAYVSATQLTISLSANDQATAGTYPVVVTNPAPGGGGTNAVNFTVNNPGPAITSLSPASLIAGAVVQTLVISGSGFVQTSTAAYNGAAHSVTFTSSSVLGIQLSASDLATAGTYPVVVTNPSPGGGVSNTYNFTVQAANAGASLNVTISGLPATSANVVVEGLNGYSQKVTATTTLGALTAGTYTITASVAWSGSASSSSYYWPTLSASSVSLVPGTLGNVTVSYQTLTGDWKPIGPFSIQWGDMVDAGELGALAVVNSNPNVMFAGGGCFEFDCPVTETGAYKTTDGGKTWTPVNNGLTDPVVPALYLDPSNPSVVLAGSTTGGIFRSTDGGATWNLLASSLGPVSTFISYNGAILAGTGQGIARSSDDGATWTLLEPTNASVWSISVSSAAIYAALRNGTVIAQTSPGGPWTTSNPSGTSGFEDHNTVAVDPANPQNAFDLDMNAVNNSTATLYSTTNGGQSWSKVGGTCGINRTIAIAPSNGTLYLGCSGGALSSTNGGGTWTSIGGPGDYRLILPDALGVQGNLIAGSDQGLFELPSGATTWQSLNGNITTSIITGFVVQGSTVIAPAQDWNEPLVSFDGGSTWAASTAFTGEAGLAVVNPGQTMTFYVTSPYGGLYTSLDGGHTFSTTLPNSTLVLAIGLDPQTPWNVYAATTNGVSKSTDYGQTFSATTWPLTGSLYAIAVDPHSSGNIYVAGSSEVHFSKDGGATWQQTTAANCQNAGATLAVDPGNSNNIAVGQCNQAAVSIDGGTTFTLAANTGPFQVLDLQFDPLGSGVLAAATSNGIYLSSDMGGHWTSIRGNAVSQFFSTLQWSPNNLFVATRGEGILQLVH